MCQKKGLKTILSEEGRVKSIVFKRTMTPLQVQSLIQRSFASISHEGAFSFLVATKATIWLNHLFQSPVGMIFAVNVGLFISIRVENRYALF